MSRLQDLFKKYGPIAIGVHLTIYAATLAGKHFSFTFRSTSHLRAKLWWLTGRADLVLNLQEPTLQ